MPHTAQKPPKYRHYKPKNLAVVRIGGKDHYLGKYGSAESHERYARLIADYHRQFRSSIVPPPNTNSTDQVLTINELILRYWKFVESYYVKNGEPTDQQHGIRAALDRLRKLYGLSEARQFGPLALKNVRQVLIEADLARSYINSRVDRIRRMFRWAASEELLPVTVYQALASVPGLRKGRCPGVRESKPVKSAPPADIEAANRHAPPQIRAMNGLLQAAAMRPGEVVIMRPCDIEQTGEVWHYRLPTHKTEHFGISKVVVLGPKAQEILKPWLKGRKSTEYLFSPSEVMAVWNYERKKRRKSAMTPSQVARRPKKNPKRPPRDHYDVGSYRQAVERACRKAGVPVWTPRQVRHTSGTEIRQHYGLEAAQAVLGHAHAKITEIYAERNLKLAEKVMGEIG